MATTNRVRESHEVLVNLISRNVRDAGFDLVSVKASPGLIAVPVAEGQDIGIVCSPESEDYQAVISRVHKYIAAKHRFTRIAVIRPRKDESFRKRLRRSFDVDTTTPPEIGEYLREWRESFDDDDEPTPRIRIDKEIAEFSELVQGKVRSEGFERVAHSRYWFIVSLGGSRYAGVIPAEHLSRELVLEAVTRVKANSPMRVTGTVIVVAKALTEQKRDALSKLYSADVIAVHEVERYFRALRPPVRDDPKDPARKGSPKTSATKGIISNAAAIATITRSLAIQIDTKLAALKDQKPNDPDSIAAKEVAISEYKLLKSKVSELERAVAELRSKKPKTAPAIKAGKVFGAQLGGWWEKSSHKVFDKVVDRSVSGIDVGIACAGAAVLFLIGVDPATAAMCASGVVTGKNVAIRKKKL